MITAAWIWSQLMFIPARMRLYLAAGVVIVIALLRWRVVGIRRAVDRVHKKDRERAQRIRERVAVARDNHPDGDDDIVRRLRDGGHIYDD